MNNRVYGVIGVKSIMSNWNADFSGYPKSISTGEVFGSDKALKYPIKRYWEDNNELVLNMRSFGMNSKNELQVRNLGERYEYLFKKAPGKDKKEITLNLFRAIDVVNFGATYAADNNNISITGAVQIGQGFNKYSESRAEVQNILSPFRDSTKGDANSTTLGTKIVSNEAHYFYNFTINPNVYNDYCEVLGGEFSGYSEEHYQKFKSAALIGATAFNTNSKIGSENEFAIFIEATDDLYLPELSQYIFFEKSDPTNTNTAIEKNIIGFVKDFNLLNVPSIKSRIKSIEVYYNPYTTDLDMKIENAKYYNIFTKEEL